MSLYFWLGREADESIKPKRRWIIAELWGSKYHMDSVKDGWEVRLLS